MKAPTPGPDRRMRDLEGYRAFAAIGVLAFHCYQFCRGGPTFGYAYEGTPLGIVFVALDSLVDLFLVLSAYLLYSPIAHRIVDGRPLESPRSFALKRAVRILPLYWTAVLVVWTSRNGGFPGYWVDLLEHLTFTQVYDSRYIFWTIGPAWSLAVEVHLYLVLVLALALAPRLAVHRRSRRARYVVLCSLPMALLVASTAWNLHAVWGGVPETSWATWFNPLAKAHMLATGMLLAVARVALRTVLPLGSRGGWALRLGAVAVLVTTATTAHESTLQVWVHHQVTTGAYAALVASSVLVVNRDPFRRALSAPALVWLGGISYSIYLWHEPVLHLLADHGLVSRMEDQVPWVILTLLATALPVAIVSHYVLDVPFGRLRAALTPQGRLADYSSGYALAEHPVVEDSVAEQPVVEDSVAEQPVVEDSVAEHPPGDVPERDVGPNEHRRGRTGAHRTA